MKKTSVLALLLIFTITVLITSCVSTRGYYSQTPSPRYHTSFSLIINPRPGFVLNRYYDGRYYYRSPEGYIYWRGYDNRFYLDRTYIGRVHYDHREYNEWKHYDRNDHFSRRHY